MTHTPGPFYVGTMNDGLFIINTPPRPAPMDHLTRGNPDTKVIATVHTGDDDARLISAAPDMLKALEYARRFLNFKDHDLAFVNAAIAKAKGEPNA